MSYVMFHNLIQGQIGGANCRKVCYQQGLSCLVDRLCEAGAVLQTALSLINLFSDSVILFLHPPYPSYPSTPPPTKRICTTVSDGHPYEVFGSLC